MKGKTLIQAQVELELKHKDVYGHLAFIEFNRVSSSFMHPVELEL